MNFTNKLTTSANIIVPTNIVALSTFDYCDWLDHHIFKDTSLTPSGYDFVYPLTAFGGTYSMFNLTFTKTICGGPFYDYCYQDFCFESFVLQPINLFCISNVNFVLSAFDESENKIIRLIYDFGDNSALLIKNYSFSQNAIPLKEQIVSHIYYPTEKFVTAYMPRISAVYEDGCITTVIAVLCSFKCSLIDSYKDMVLLDATQSKVSRSIFLTLEDRVANQLFSSTLDLDAPYTTFVTDVPDVLSAAVTVDTVIQTTSARITYLNPVVVEPIIYDYVEGDGINLTPDVVSLLEGDLLYSLSGDIVIPENTGAPYTISDSLIITPQLLRTPSEVNPFLTD